MILLKQRPFYNYFNFNYSYIKKFNSFISTPIIKLSMETFIKNKIVICGGGNGSHASVSSAGSKPHIFEVCVYTRKPKEW